MRRHDDLLDFAGSWDVQIDGCLEKCPHCGGVHLYPVGEYSTADDTHFNVAWCDTCEQFIEFYYTFENFDESTGFYKNCPVYGWKSVLAGDDDA